MKIVRLSRKFICPKCKNTHIYILYFSKPNIVKKHYIICKKDIDSLEIIEITCIYCNTVFPIHRNEFSFYLSRKIEDSDVYDKLIDNFKGLFKVVDSIEVSKRAALKKTNTQETRIKALKKCNFLVAYFNHLNLENILEIAEKHHSNTFIPCVYLINPNGNYKKNRWMKKYVIKTFKNVQKFYIYFIEGICELHYVSQKS